MLGPVSCLDDRLDIFVKKKRKATGSASDRVHLQLNALNFSEGLKIFLKLENKSSALKITIAGDKPSDHLVSIPVAIHQRRVSDPPRTSRQPWLIENDSESIIHYWNKYYLS